MQILTITDSSNTEVVRVQIGDVDPATATVAILTALKQIPPRPTPRARRSDAGRARATV